MFMQKKIRKISRNGNVFLKHLIKIFWSLNTIFFIANESCLHNFQNQVIRNVLEYFQIIFVSVWKNWKLFLSTKYKLFTVEEMKCASLSSYVSLELTLVILICLQSRSTHSKSNGKSTLRLVHIVSISS